MKVLGVVNDDTAGACLVIDNCIISAVSEERFSRIKMDAQFPYQSIEYVLNNSGLVLDDVDYIGYGWNKGFEQDKHLLMYVDRVEREITENSSGLEILKERILVEMDQDAIKRNEFEKWVDDNNLRPKVVYFNHHECHAISAFACSPFEESLVITSDARGDFESLQVSHFNKNNECKVLYRCPSFDSLGFFYGRITSLLGFTPARHEGKVTGLAARGDALKYIDLMKEMISFEDGKLIGQMGDWYRPFFTNYSDPLKKLIANAKTEDIAAAAQVHLENLVREITKYYLSVQPSKYICLAGGVFGNVRVNQEVMGIKGVDNVFVQPHMGDGGLSLGAAIGIPFIMKKKKSEMRNMYLGPEFSNKEILNSLENYDSINYKYVDDIVPEAIKAISNDNVVGLFQGRMEFGPRALCNRSIIYHCNDKDINNWLNDRLHRTEFMPFAPVTAEEFAAQCYKDWHSNHISSRYMAITYRCTKLMEENCPAVVHIDNTARPQVVGANDNFLMYKILHAWYDKTGGLSLINTSFNKHEEPIVCTPDDGIAGLVDNQVDVLVIGNYIVSRSD